ncbi:MAG: hypothetical protein Q4F07_02435 [Bacteroidales bacterium]|nr:hypothetical protein [Bacteroidales bacterium]
MNSMHKITVLTVAAIIAVLAATSCTSGEKETQRQHTPHNPDNALIEAGRNDARKALEYDSAGSERINAILSIHARAYELSSQGMPDCAADYLSGAKEVLTTQLQTPAK